MLTVRRANQNDLLGLSKLIAAMHRETEFKYFRLNFDKIVDSLCNWMDNGLLIVAEKKADDSNDVVGMMAGSKRPQWYSDDNLIAEDFLFVREDFRGTRAAYLLLREFMLWANEQGAEHIRAGVATGTGESANRLYEHFGLHYVGGNFVTHIPRS
jgi:GNAT superfamily N-acetyltransferase